jgi:UDP-N-acetylmuramoyl-L-alanyl-D-glutamate--2,6-diaminopimelate ligase
MSEIDIAKITGVTSDSRAVKDGYVFVAIKGEQSDGHDYIVDAIKNGAFYIVQNPSLEQRMDNNIVSSSSQQMEYGQGALSMYDYVRFVESDNTRRDLSIIASAFYKAHPDHVIAVTGTNGKTSVVEFIRQLLEMDGKSAASIGTLGVQSNAVQIDGAMTTPDAVILHDVLAQLKQANVDYAAIEASSHGLHQHRLDGARIAVAAFTNLTQDHLDYHGDMDTYFAAKNRLFENILDDDGVAVVNIDDKYGEKINHDNIMSYGMADNADLRLISQTPKANGQDIVVSYNGEAFDIHLPLIGQFQAYNVLCAAACCIALGLDAKSVFACCSKLNGVDGRMQLAATVNGASAYIDYAHTPDALENALKSLRPHTDGRLVCVFGAGGNRDKTKRPLMGKVVCDHADIAIITDDNPRGEDSATIRNEIFSACSMAENIGGRAEAIGYATSVLTAGDILLVAGKGHEQGQTINGTTHPFDDLSVTRQAMEANTGK